MMKHWGVVHMVHHKKNNMEKVFDLLDHEKENTNDNEYLTQIYKAISLIMQRLKIEEEVKAMEELDSVKKPFCPKWEELDDSDISF